MTFCRYLLKKECHFIANKVQRKSGILSYKKRDEKILLILLGFFNRFGFYNMRNLAQKLIIISFYERKGEMGIYS